MQSLRQWSVRHACALKRIYDAGAQWAPYLRRPVQWLGARSAERLLLPIERAGKRLLFDCKMCGQCVLSSTGMACPTNCPKQMRNGPCGGVRADRSCEVDPTMRCVWVAAIDGGHSIGGLSGKTVLEPIDHRLWNRSSWLRVIAGTHTRPIVVQPSEPPARETFGFEQACQSGRLVVTAEVSPPDSADPAVLLKRAAPFRNLVDAINITDGAGANCHMSSAAAAAVLVADGFTPVAQFCCRDRNRIALQGDILGAAALGVRNILCLTGDDVSQGDHPDAKPVFDLDSISLLRMTAGMRDLGSFASGRKLAPAPNLFLGATANPFVPPFADRCINLEKKIDAGARFIQTQFCFDLPLLAEFMREVRARELHKQCAIIVGVGTLGSAKALRRMAQHVPGVHIPDAVLRRIGSAENARAEAKRLVVETIRAVSDIEGVAGVHLMGYRVDDILTEAIVESGIRHGVRTRAA
ncbi:MAG TPA: methylenetetrahydrofolate reductase C-terminal domain-containing protein [Xanthobacteraceae bacterium]|nr:methylenetetrahydrofolate reductase C-terminal domain-containing protein [Xanthobacteraceae bacterium]